MRFHLALVSSFLFALVVSAHRRREHHQTWSTSRAKHSTTLACGEVDYNDIWAGALLEKSNGTFTFVTGTFTAPVLSDDGGTSASAWVGIDGDCKIRNSGLWQAGVDFFVTEEGPTYYAWYEWYPAGSYYFMDLSVSAGDAIRVNVTALSTTSGLATIENLTNQQQASKYVHSTYALCMRDAEWIVEDLSDGHDNKLPFANFSTVTFTQAEATGPKGIYTPADAYIVDIKQNGQILTASSVNESSVTINYV